jgi:hypothetical protein
MLFKESLEEDIEAYAACHGNRHVFALTLQRMCVVEKTKAFFMVRSSSFHTMTSLKCTLHHETTKQHVVLAEWNFVMDQCQSVTQILALFWRKHLPADEKMMLTFCDTVAHIMGIFTRAIVNVHEEAAHYD